MSAEPWLSRGPYEFHVISCGLGSRIRLEALTQIVGRYINGDFPNQFEAYTICKTLFVPIR
ncbi:hypothetical protein XAP412_1420003 [Xanthomonas phaseoli pv. phaseoli]|uniref:Uncharacterized protein n=1 Tax=Xanthomonas campestris pv. phaseoli TaxID=317013 RepID=A0AB38DX20_XANCH|nr:hypothetical protein XAP6984_1500003 [Xanthomonas phaseoli pv. phaseoli]SON80347.1 hypothetical protein XAP412_1420003 [Xanthomonas phaseoli pv. phaseoli]SON83563.1 hypothetical protein XAP7430_1460003 [Xanthomonas phaseoli pv. phaseoli]